MRIGVVDLDTSHPAAWIPIERELGHEIAGVWDGGSVHPESYVREFASEHDVPRIHDSLREMAGEVDCAIIHGCDWDTHVDKARPFIEAGKAVLVDKPVAGNASDLKQFSEWARQGARIAGGSSLRFCYEAQNYLARPAEERGTPHTVLTGCAVDEFNYGIHAYATAFSFLGPGVVSVRHLGKHVQRHIQLTWDDGRMGFLNIGQTATWLPFYVTAATEKSVHQVDGCADFYKAMLEAVLPYLEGKAKKPPIAFEQLIEPEWCALAAKLSWEDGDREVTLDEVRDTSVSYDGAQFAREYRDAKYG